jgi:hypothetical protein
MSISNGSKKFLDFFFEMFPTNIPNIAILQTAIPGIVLSSSRLVA